LDLAGVVGSVDAVVAVVDFVMSIVDFDTEIGVVVALARITQIFQVRVTRIFQVQIIRIQYNRIAVVDVRNHQVVLLMRTVRY
jgi:hypothetical protein